VRPGAAVLSGIGLVRATAGTGVFDRQRGHLFPWVPVAYACGIGLYFALPVEPSRAVWWALGLTLAAGVVTAATVARHAPLLIALLAALAGVGVAGLRTAEVAEPVLPFRYYGPIEGRIVAIDRSQSDKPRLTLDRVVLADVPPGRTPTRVRVSLHGEQRWVVPEPGLTVILTGHLAAPDGPVEPGGYDFRRQAWFDGLGAVGYTRTPVLTLRPAEEGRAGLLIYRIRMAVTAEILETLPGPVGGFAAAITTGVRSTIDAETTEALRISSLQHILSISGLHMVLVTAFVFGVVRYGMAAIPPLALRLPAKKIGAGAALVAGALYLALSGSDVPAERAYIQVAVVLVAVLLDRRALTLRAVALAALIVLTLRPEALTEAGFQMSFAATVALVAAFEAVRDVERAHIHRWARPLMALVLSSFVAGTATAPFAAAHFNQIPHYGLLANTLAVPVMGMLVMPAAVLAAVLAPFGLHWIGLWLMRPGIEWILFVANWVAGLPGAVSFAPSPPVSVMPLIALGGLWVILWQGRARALGVLPIALAAALWGTVQRPDVLIAGSGGLVGAMTPEGRALSKARGDGFAAETWLENDGDPVGQEAAFARSGLTGEEGARTLLADGVRVIHLTGRSAAEALPAVCTDGAVVVLTAEAEATGDCTLLDAKELRRTGTVALYAGSDGVRMQTVRDWVGERPWTGAWRQ
jgi:competence protein ComEC